MNLHCYSVTKYLLWFVWYALAHLQDYEDTHVNIDLERFACKFPFSFHEQSILNISINKIIDFFLNIRNMIFRVIMLSIEFFFIINATQNIRTKAQQP